MRKYPFCVAVRAIALAGAILVLAAGARAGVAPPEPGVIDKSQFREGEDIFRIRFPDKPYEGPLATCPVCGKPLKDHTEPGFVCRSPNAPPEPINERRALCPVCGLEFKGLVVEAAGGRGTIDSDFCRHTKGRRTQVAGVWMCPRCGYSALHEEFNATVGEEVKTFVAKIITPGTKTQLGKLIGLRPKTFTFDDFSFLDQPSIPDFIKYENAAAIYRERKADAWSLGRVHLGASHVYRRLLNGAFTAEGLDGAIRRMDAILMEDLMGDDEPLAQAKFIRRLLGRSQEKDAPPTEKLSGRERFYLYMRLAGLHDRLGEGWWTEQCFSEAEKLAAAEPDERVRRSLLGLVREHRGHLARELYHQTSAAASFKVALELGRVPTEERLTAVYLVGELLARIGEIARAIPWLEAASTLARGQGADKKGVADLVRSRLATPAFLGEDGRRLPADGAEKASVERLLQSLATGDARPAGEGPPGPAAAPSPRVAEAPRDRETPPATCEELMRLVWKAISAYREARGGEFPPNLQALLDAGLITRGAVGEFKCPATGKTLFYRKPPAGSAKTFILYHADPKDSPCKNILYSDGTIGQFGK